MRMGGGGGGGGVISYWCKVSPKYKGFIYCSHNVAAQHGNLFLRPPCRNKILEKTSYIIFCTQEGQELCDPYVTFSFSGKEVNTFVLRFWL